MFATHFARVIRNFSQNRFYSMINFSVLVVGITSCILVIFYVLHQSGFDAHHENADRIFRLSTEIKMGEGGGKTAQTSVHLGPLLKKECTFIVQYARLHPFNFESFKIQCDDRVFKETGILGAESSVFEVFTHPMLVGNPKTALNRPNAIVLTESLARKYFGTVDCLGKMLKVDYEEYGVTGVIEDLPANADLRFKALISHDFGVDEDWDDMKYFTYVLTSAPGDHHALEQALTRFEVNYITPYYAETGMDLELDLFFTPLREVHFVQGMVYDTPKSNYLYVYIFLAIGLFTLAIACFNFINLAAVQSFKRSKEVAVKGVLGVRRRQIIFQFVSESVILTLLSLCMSLILVAVILPYFNALAQIEVTFAAIFHWKSLLMIGFIVLTLGVVSAVIPALYLTSFSLPKILKGKLPGFNRGFLYRALLVGQFAMSIIMIICTLAVYRQLQYMKETSLGFRMDKVVVIHPPDEMGYVENNAFKKALSEYSSLSVVSLVGENSTPGSSAVEKNEAIIEREGKESIMDVFNTISIDENYFEVLGIELVSGRNFNPLIKGDHKNAFIVNEAFLKHAGWTDATNKKLGFHNGGVIIGVVKNYNYKSLHSEIEPLIMYYNQGGQNNEMLVKIQSESDLDVIEKTWRTHAGKNPFSFSFLDQNFDNQYQQEQATMTMFFLFSVLVIALTCLGLFGLSSLITKQRVREIGIRKVLGGNEVNIVYVLLKDVVVLLFFSIFIAAPIARYGIALWQREFSYQAEIGFMIYISAWCLTLATTLFTAFYHTFSAARTNPVLALRQE
jgi:putative ABC transport system permease protein